MIRYSLFLLLLLVHVKDIQAQQKIRKLPYNINKPSLSISHPFISGDGESLLYLTNYTDNGSLTMFWTRKNGALWQDGIEVNRLVNRPDMNLQGAFSLNYDGNFLIVTSQKSGLGGFELWYSELKNGDWSALKNFGAPINSRANEGGAVLTTDEKGMYFMRCEQMNTQSADGCQLYFAEKKYGRWQEPQILPENINRYSPQMPRIMADGETLIFSSNTAGGQGGFDLYMSRKNGSGWEDPINLEFANTPKDDQFISVAAKSRYLYKAQPGERNMEIVQLLFPDDLKPREVYRINGTVKDEAGNPVKSELKVFDIMDRKRLINEETENDGSFSFVLVEGSSYDVSLEPLDNQYRYFAKIYDLHKVPARDRETLNITLTPYPMNQPIVNENISFNPFAAEVSDKSIFEIRRLASFMRAHPEYNIKITSNLFAYREDSIASDSLTEIRIDSVHQPISEFIPSNYLNTTITDTVNIDSLETNGAYYTSLTDTLVIMIDADSIHMQNLEHSIVIPSRQLVIKTTYHNDRTQAEAEAIKTLLIDHGVEAEKIITEGVVHDPPLEAMEEILTNPRSVEITISEN